MLLVKKRYKLATIYAHKGLIFVPIIGLSLVLLDILQLLGFFKLLGCKMNIYKFLWLYINPILFGAIFFMFNFSLNSVLVATGDTKTYRNSLIFGFFANLVLNPIFIYGFLFIPAMGIKVCNSNGSNSSYKYVLYVLKSITNKTYSLWKS